MNVNAITLETTDIDALLEFYCEVFDVHENSKIEYDETHKGFSLDNLYLGFDKVDTVSSGSNVVIWFNAYNVQELFDKFVNAGAEVILEPTDEESPGEILARVKDPVGNKIGIIGPVIKDKPMKENLI